MASTWMLMNITDGILQLPANIPPAGVKPDFAHPSRRDMDVLVAGSVVTALMLACMTCRVYSKLFLTRKWTWDDATCTLAALGTLTCYGDAVWMVTQGTWGQHSWEIRLSDLLNPPNLISLYIFGWGQLFAIVFIKATFFLMFWRLFGTLRYMKIAILICSTLSVLACFVSTLFAFVIATPVNGQTWTQHAGTLAQSWIPQLAVENAATSAASDLLILILPVPAILGLQMPRKRQCAVLAVFFVGALGCAAAIVNLYIRTKIYVGGLATSDASYATEPVLAASLVEFNLGICCSCAPAISYILRRSERFASWTARLTSTHGRRSEQQQQPSMQQQQHHLHPHSQTYYSHRQDSGNFPPQAKSRHSLFGANVSHGGRGSKRSTFRGSSAFSTLRNMRASTASPLTLRDTQTSPIGTFAGSKRNSTGPYSSPYGHHGNYHETCSGPCGNSSQWGEHDQCDPRSHWHQHSHFNHHAHWNTSGQWSHDGQPYGLDTNDPALGPDSTGLGSHAASAKPCPGPLPGGGPTCCDFHRKAVAVTTTVSITTEDQTEESSDTSALRASSPSNAPSQSQSQSHSHSHSAPLDEKFDIV